MPITVLLPIALRQFTDGKDKIEIEGTNIQEVLNHLVEKCCANRQ